LGVAEHPCGGVLVIRLRSLRGAGGGASAKLKPPAVEAFPVLAREQL
jgi:hypothetical protein